jgi:hypothetical protein
MIEDFPMAIELTVAPADFNLLETWSGTARHTARWRSVHRGTSTSTGSSTSIWGGHRGGQVRHSGARWRRRRCEGHRTGR